MMNRREFMLAAGIGSVSSGCVSVVEKPKSGFGLAMAGYTLHKFSVDGALDFCERHGFTSLCVKNFHLPYNSTVAQVSVFRAKCEDHGVRPYAVGPISIKDGDDPRRYFDYAAILGVNLIVGVPAKRGGAKGDEIVSDPALCSKCSDLADEYKVRFAIHNHGRNPLTGNPKLYPAVPETFKIIKDMSHRMGLCVDWAYTHADGLDCSMVARIYGGRIFDGHVRCLKSRDNGSVSTSPASRCFDYAELFEALRKIGYSGMLGLECADAFTIGHPEWIDQSKAYFESLM